MKEYERVRHLYSWRIAVKLGMEFGVQVHTISLRLDSGEHDPPGMAALCCTVNQKAKHEISSNMCVCQEKLCKWARKS